MWGFILTPLRVLFCFVFLIQISFLSGVSAAVVAWICIKYIGHYIIALTQQEMVK